MSGRRRNSGTLPGSRRFTFESRTFPKFWPDTESFESRGERSKKDSVYRDYTNFQEPERQADLSVCLSVCERPVDARNGPVNAKLVCRCIVVRIVFVVGLNLLPPTPSSPVLSLRFPMKKKKCIVDRGIVEIHTYPFIVVFLSFVLWRLWRQHTTTEIVPR